MADLVQFSSAPLIFDWGTVALGLVLIFFILGGIEVWGYDCKHIYALLNKNAPMRIKGGGRLFVKHLGLDRQVKWLQPIKSKIVGEWGLERQATLAALIGTDSQPIRNMWDSDVDFSWGMLAKGFDVVIESREGAMTDLARKNELMAAELRTLRAERLAWQKPSIDTLRTMSFEFKHVRQDAGSVAVPTKYTIDGKEAGTKKGDDDSG